MISSPPKLRKDLIVSEKQTARSPSFVVKDPVSGEFFRFGEAEGFIARQLDGETPIDVVRQRTEEQFGGALPEGTLNAFVKTLGKNGLLETTKTKEASQRSRVRGSLLYLRFRLFDPDRLFSFLVRRVGLFFTLHFLVLSAGLILLAAGTTIANWSELTQDFSRLYRLSAIPLLLTVTFVLASAHEFAHGLTCKRFGGEVHEIGFMLLYFQPAFYCNVSDAWLFPERWKRLWVALAGPYFELVLWALATLAWRLTDMETWVNYLALMVMTVSGIKTLLNFNPFIKLDGYYLLSDYLDLPNLRRKSFRYLGGLVARLFCLRPQAAGEVSRRERRIYLSYGLAATATSFCLLAYVAVMVGGFLIESHQMVALLLLAGLVGTRFHRRLRKLFGRRSDPSDASDDADKLEPSTAKGSPEPREPRRKRSRSWKRGIQWTALTVATLAVLSLGRMELRITGPFTILPEENADVRAAVEGIVRAIHVDEGDEVKAGDLIARLSNEALLADLRKTSAEMRETSANLKKLEAGPTAEEIEVAKASVSKAGDRLKYAQSRLARLGQLLEEDLLSRVEFEDAQDLATTAENDLVEAKARLNELLRGTRPEDIDATRARLDRMETQQHYLEEEVRKLNVVSPVTGVVVTPSRQLKEMERRLLGAGDLIAKVHDFKTVKAQIIISEKEISCISLGQKVVLRARAYPDMTFHGTVTSIATTAQGSSSVGGQTAGGTTYSDSAFGTSRIVVVTTQIANPSLLIKPEMTGQAKVFCGQRRIVDLIQWRLARTFKVELWSWW